MRQTVGQIARAYPAQAGEHGADRACDPAGEEVAQPDRGDHDQGQQQGKETHGAAERRIERLARDGHAYHRHRHAGRAGDRPGDVVHHLPQRGAEALAVAGSRPQGIEDLGAVGVQQHGLAAGLGIGHHPSVRRDDGHALSGLPEELRAERLQVGGGLQGAVPVQHEPGRQRRLRFQDMQPPGGDSPAVAAPGVGRQAQDAGQQDDELRAEQRPEEVALHGCPLSARKR